MAKNKARIKFYETFDGYSGWKLVEEDDSIIVMSGIYNTRGDAKRAAIYAKGAMADAEIKE